MLEIALLASLFAVKVADLPPGAVMRLGDARWRAGSRVDHIALSPDGKQCATVRKIRDGMLMLTMWDSATGHPIREQEMNSELFKGFVWGKSGAFAVFIRAEPGKKDKPGKLFPNDFRVWDFTDPKTMPPVLPIQPSFNRTENVYAERPEAGPEYGDFVFSSDGHRVAARWKSADGKHAVRIFELKPTDAAAKLTRVGNIDLGAEGADGVRLSADGKVLVTFRTIASPDTSECTATAWDVGTGTPTKPVRMSPTFQHWPTLTPDGSELVDYDYGWKGQEKGYEFLGYVLVELATGTRKKLARALRSEPTDLLFASRENLPADAVFLPSGRSLVESDSPSTIVDLTSGKELGRIGGHLSPPTAIAVSADGNRIATADRFGLIRLWDAKTFRAIHDAPGHISPVKKAQLSPDGKRVVTWAWDGTVRVWNLATGKELRVFTGAPGLSGTPPSVYDEPTFSPDSMTVLFSTKDRLIARDILTGLEVPLPGDMAKLPPRIAVFSPDGKAVLTWGCGDDDTGLCNLWDWPSGKKRFAWKAHRGSFAPGFSADGSVIFYHPTSPERWDAKTGKELPVAWKEPRGDHVHPLVSLRPSPNLALFERTETNAMVFEAATDKPVSGFHFGSGHSFPGSYQPMAMSPTGRQYAWAYAIGGEPDRVYLCESASCTVRRLFPGHRGEVRVLGFTPDGTKLLTAGDDHTVLVWDMRLQAVPLPEAVRRETNAAKLWATMCVGKADEAFLAMARLAAEPEAAVQTARMRLRPATDAASDSANQLADSRAIELLEALGTPEARAFLKELAVGHADAFRTQEAKRALERLGK